MCQTPSNGQTDTSGCPIVRGQTDKRTDTRNRIWCIFALKCDILVEIILMIFLTINWPNFVYLLVDAGFLSLKFLFSISLRQMALWHYDEKSGFINWPIFLRFRDQAAAA